jgi:hypothetical protein
MNKKRLQRMIDLADIKPVIKESKMSLSNFELVKSSVDGNTYAIVRENKRYHIKETKTKEGLTESDFDYLGGVANKMKKSFSSFSDATKHLNLMFEEINNHHNVEGVNLLESDSILSEKKFVLKLNNKKKSKPTPAEEPEEEESFDFGDEEEMGTDSEGGDEEFDFGGDEESEEEGTEGGDEEFDFGGDEEEESEEGDVEEFDTEGDEDLDLEDSDDEIKDIQSTTGKLGQQLRDVEDISSDMMKWVAKSVLSALDLENMDSEDKKDIIRTVKKKSDEEEPEEEESFDFGGEEETEEEEFDFGGEEEEMEESYDSYMDDDETKYGNRLNHDIEDEFPSHRDINNGRTNNDPLNPNRVRNRYDSYMNDKFNEREIDAWIEEMENMGVIDTPYQSYMKDNKKRDEDNPNIGGDEDVPEDKLLFSSENEKEFNINNSTRRHSRLSNSEVARRQAEKDLTKHYHRPAAPGYDERPSDKWAKHKLPYDTEFMWENKNITEDHFNDEMETYEQEKAYEDIEKLVRRYGMDVNLRHKETTEDPEESIIYLDIVDGDKKLLVTRINSVGDIEIGEMKGKNFVGEPLDSVQDFIEIFGEDLTSKEKENLRMNQPQKSPKETPSEPTTKPGTPDKTPGKDRPSRRPFNPPPHITPGEEPGPKADYDDYMADVTMSPSPAPSKPSPSKDPATKPGTPDKTPGKDRPSRRPFNPPPHITPGEEPGPKADYEDDVEFE